MKSKIEELRKECKEKAKIIKEIEEEEKLMAKNKELNKKLKEKSLVGKATKKIFKWGGKLFENL